jgi:dolichyl-phosphate-mannose--protein O-mannosyl transferase
MPVTKRRWFVHAHLAWMITAALVLSLLNSLTYELFFVTSLIGFLIVIQLTAPFRITPPWRRRIRWITMIGLLSLVLILIQRMITILPPKLLA